MKRKSSEQLTLSGNEEEILTRLHERVEKAIAMIQDLRRERDALKEDCERLQKERDEIRNRIETILSSLQSLEVSE